MKSIGAKKTNKLNLLLGLAVMVFLLIISSTVLANDIKVIRPGILPDSPAYELKLKLEERELSALTDPLEQANLHIKLAYLRLSEAVVIEEMGKTQYTKELISRYNEHIKQAMLLFEEIGGLRKLEELRELGELRKENLINITILQSLIDNAPEEVQLAVQLTVYAYNYSEETDFSEEVFDQIKKGELILTLPEEAEEILKALELEATEVPEIPEEAPTMPEVPEIPEEAPTMPEVPEIPEEAPTG